MRCKRSRTRLWSFERGQCHRHVSIEVTRIRLLLHRSFGVSEASHMIKQMRSMSVATNCEQESERQKRVLDAPRRAKVFGPWGLSQHQRVNSLFRAVFCETRVSVPSSGAVRVMGQRQVLWMHHCSPAPPPLRLLQYMPWPCDSCGSCHPKPGAYTGPTPCSHLLAWCNV